MLHRHKQWQCNGQEIEVKGKLSEYCMHECIAYITYLMALHCSHFDQFFARYLFTTGNIFEPISLSYNLFSFRFLRLVIDFLFKDCYFFWYIYIIKKSLRWNGIFHFLPKIKQKMIWCVSYVRLLYFFYLKFN